MQEDPQRESQVRKSQHVGQDEEDDFTAASPQNHTQKQYL